MNIAYVRVSTEEQDGTRQREPLEKHRIHKWFVDKASGKNTDRPEFQQLFLFAPYRLAIPPVHFVSL